MICVSGCTTYSAAPVNLPSLPAYTSPVAEPLAKVDDDAVIAFREMRGALRLANGRLVQTRGWYSGVKKRYGAKL